MATIFQRTALARVASPGAALLAVACAAGCTGAGSARRGRVILSSSIPAAPTPPERPSREPARAAPPSAPAPAPSPAAPGSIGVVLAAARASVGRPTRDCAGFIESLFERVGVDLLSEARRGDGGVLAFARYVKRHGRWHTRRLPSAGDLVFFHNSYDRDRDGKLDDLFTHVGIVDEVGADGTAQIIHSTNHGIVREPMNLLHPHRTRDDRGQPINAPLRRKLSREPPRTPHLMSELFAGFGTVVEPPVVAVHCARRRCGSRS